MKFVILCFMIFFFTSCNKPKAVLICGDHICVNKAEANQYFEKNLIIEVKIIDNDIKNEIDLVELNLKKNQNGEKIVKIFSKDKTNENLKILSKQDINEIKKNIKKKKKINKKEIKIEKEIVEVNKNIDKDKDMSVLEIDVNKIKQNNLDVCTILKKCDIQEISEYLIKQGKKKKFPDISKR